MTASFDYPTLYSLTGDIKDINTLLVPASQLEAIGAGGVSAPGAQLSGPPDPLQGAANWLLEVVLDSTTADLQNRLSIGYNRARRLLSAARSAAPITPKE